MKEKPLVSIGCTTYNQEPYIRQCIEGFLMQKTNFPFEIIINDDCSTDGTTEIIKEYEKQYPNLINAIYHSENQQSRGVRSVYFEYVFPAARGKYMAMCEGDDYWTDPLKLQKQVDFLEKYNEYSLVYSKVKVVNGQGTLMNYFGREDTFDSLLSQGSHISTPSTCFRLHFYKKFLKEVGIHSDWEMTDFPLWLFIAYYSKIKYMDVVFASYRVLENSASNRNNFHNRAKFKSSFYNICEYFAIKYNHKDKIRQIHKNKIEALLSLSLEFNRKPPTEVWQLIFSKNHIYFVHLIKCIFLSITILRKSYLFLHHHQS